MLIHTSDPETTAQYLITFDSGVRTIVVGSVIVLRTNGLQSGLAMKVVGW